MIVQPMPAPGLARLVARLVALALTIALSPQLLPAQSAPPPAPVRPVTDTLHGVAVTDPYRWMEDKGQELTDRLRAQDAYTRAVLARIPGRDRLLAELRALTTDAAVVSQARRFGDQYVYLMRRNVWPRSVSANPRQDHGPSAVVHDAAGHPPPLRPGGGRAAGLPGVCGRGSDRPDRGPRARPYPV